MRRAGSLIGIDIGSTTSSAILADAELSEVLPGGRVALRSPKERLRTPIFFTPFRDGDVDSERLFALLDDWLGGAGELLGGGALITGLAARSPSAPRLAEGIRERLGNALIATAQDPHLESWLAFMGSVSELSCAHPEQAFLNLDIGGGTTNLALGADGKVLRTGCMAIGARHVQLQAGSWKLLRLSAEVDRFFRERSLHFRPGEEIAAPARKLLLDHWITRMEAVVLGADLEAEGELEAGMSWPPAAPSPKLVYSGGVGELVYRLLQEDIAETAPYGDLGVDLARSILASPVLSKDLSHFQPEGKGRAVAY